jgi:hypothetical protein
MQRLGTAINDAITTSDEVDAALSDVREKGIDVFLVLEATICVRHRSGEAIEGLDAGGEEAEETEVEMSHEDLQFLKRLRISVDVEGDEED